MTGLQQRGTSGTIPALPLWQPWASLVVMGAKRIETRHWPAPQRIVGQRIAIHATKTQDWLHLRDEEPFNLYVGSRDPLPLGALIGTVIVKRCSEITPAAADELEERNWAEFCFGNYEPGRFAWVLGDPLALAQPVPWKGSQGIFNVPAELVDVEPAQGVLA